MEWNLNELQEQKKDIVKNITELNQEIRAKHPTLVNPDCMIDCEFQFLDKYCRIQKATEQSPLRLARLLCMQPTDRRKKRVKK